jgi:hypothetical protein
VPDDYDFNRYNFCPRCGTKAVAHSSFCAACGHSLLKQSPDVGVPAKSQDLLADTWSEPSATADLVDVPSISDVSDSEVTTPLVTDEIAPMAALPVRVAHYRAPTAIPSVQPPVTANKPENIARPKETGTFRHNGWAIGAVALLAVLLVVAGALAFQQRSTANKWMHSDQQEVQRNTTLTASLSASRKQTSSLQSQLSAVSSQKEKALDQNAALTTALQDATGVANDLDTCVTDTQAVISDMVTIAQTDFVTASEDTDATTAGQVCAQAQTANDGLQQVLSGG